MNEPTKPMKKATLFCTCSSACPSMAKVDFWALAERMRVELGDKVEFLALHPPLYEADGERLMQQILSDKTRFVTAACAVNRQQKLLRDGFHKAGVPMDADHWIPVSVATETTETVFDRIKAALEGKSPLQPESSGQASVKP